MATDQVADTIATRADQMAAQVANEILQTELLLTEAQAARIVGVKPITLRIWRYRDRKRAEGALAKAPPHRRVGVRGVRYPLDDLRAWIRGLPTSEGVPQLPDNRVQAHVAHYASAESTRPKEMSKIGPEIDKSPDAT